MASGAEPFFAYLLHLGYNLWDDWPSPGRLKERTGICPENVRYEAYLRYDSSVAADLLSRMASAGIRMVVLDLADGVRYKSHPEIAVRGAWTADRLRRELGRIRAMGMEPVPKLNFSATHDIWLGPYSRCVSTDTYYGVCRDLIAEICELFDGPRLFHLGMDEETAGHQRHQRYAVIRQYDLWWHDLYFFVGEVEKHGARAWVWSDYVWHHPREFFSKMPKTVLQSNWYYDTSFSTRIPYVKAYLDLARHGYDQVPAAAITRSFESFEKTVDFASRHIPRRRLKGFLQTVWHPTLPKWHGVHVRAIEAVARSISRWAVRCGCNAARRRLLTEASERE